MIILILIGFLGGLVTGISPCILPVLPVIFAAGAASGIDAESNSDGELVAAGQPVPATGPATATAPARPATDPDARSEGSTVVTDARPSAIRRNRDRNRRPLAVVGGLVVSFAVFTLVGSWVLSLLGLPQDLLRWIGLVVLGVVGLGLIVPVIGETLERPFARVARGRQHSEAGGFVLGISLGLVFVPCAGPVLTAIVVVSANHHYGISSIVLTAAFALGIAVPLLIFAILGQRLAERMRLVRSRAAEIGRASWRGRV